MKNRLLLFLTVPLLLLASCGGEEEQPVKQEESLVEVKDGIYTEYYPGRKAIKYQGPQDENEMRDGRWFFYSESGVELSMTEYKHGKKHGASFVRYPNGQMRYYGNYTNDKQSGVWITYDKEGNVAQEKDFGTVDSVAVNN
jgi:antitoxin component YwqK of YwqJK toxin-antitoxin module